LAGFLLCKGLESYWTHENLDAMNNSRTAPGPRKNQTVKFVERTTQKDKGTQPLLSFWLRAGNRCGF
jgi:hypothetical protein